jgi:hypothetical protein
MLASKLKVASGTGLHAFSLHQSYVAPVKDMRLGRRGDAPPTSASLL